MIIDNIKSLSIVSLVAVCVCQHMKIDEYQKDLVKAQEQARLEQVALNDKIQQISNEYSEDLKKHEDTIHNLRMRVANGVHISSKTVPNNTTTGDKQAECYINGGVANRLVDITERGDRAIMDLNKCIDKYNALREIIK